MHSLVPSLLRGHTANHCRVHTRRHNMVKKSDPNHLQPFRRGRWVAIDTNACVHPSRSFSIVSWRGGVWEGHTHWLKSSLSCGGRRVPRWLRSVSDETGCAGASSGTASAYFGIILMGARGASARVCSRICNAMSCASVAAAEAPESSEQRRLRCSGQVPIVVHTCGDGCREAQLTGNATNSARRTSSRGVPCSCASQRFELGDGMHLAGQGVRVNRPRGHVKPALACARLLAPCHGTYGTNVAIRRGRAVA